MILILWLQFNLGYSQEFGIKSIEQTAEDLIVYYDLIDTTFERTYSITLFIIDDDGSINALKNVSGDVGIEIRPGSNKKIVWGAREELGEDFAGSIQLEIRGKLYIPFIRFQGFPEGKKIKTGETQTFTWTGQSRSNILVFTLYKEDEAMYVFPEVANTGDAALVLPKSLPSGKYNLIINDSKNQDLKVQSPSFIIKKKLPFIVKLSPIIAAGAIVPFLLDSGNDNIPGPPNVPGDRN